MKFSIRFLLGLTFVIALVITAVFQQLEVWRLDEELQVRNMRHARLQKSLRRMNPGHTQMQIEICQEVLPDVDIGPEIFVAARQRFEQLQKPEAIGE